MSGISCFGNLSMGEIGNLKNLNLNPEDFLSSFKLAKLDLGKCVIPGFEPPTLPEFTIPPIPLFGGLPPFPLLCGLPPFPGIPGLSLPGISIPIPPIPFFPPIPIPIPIFSLPKLPKLPKFDLGSISFLCGLINIPLPILDPFAELNKYINKLNSFIDAFNSFLNFCRRNAETINATEVLPDLLPSSYRPLVAPKTSQVKEGGLGSVPSLVDSENESVNNEKLSQESSKPDLSKIDFSSNEPASNLAQYLANAGFILPEHINKVAKLLIPYSKISNLTTGSLEQLLAENNITSPSKFIGWMCSDLESLLPSLNAKQLIDKLTAAKLLSENKNVVAATFKITAKVDLQTISCLELASLLNNGGIPKGIPPTNLTRITADDIARAFYLNPTTAPFTPQKLIDVLKKTGVIESRGGNLELGLKALTPIPKVLDPTIIASLLIEANPGPAIGTLRGMCIATTRGFSRESSIEIALKRKEAVFDFLNNSSQNPLIPKLQKFLNFNAKSFENKYGLIFPLSIYELIPLLSIELDIDDKAFYDLISMFQFDPLFSNLEALLSFLNYVASTMSSSSNAIKAIKDCESLKEGDFVFRHWVDAISRALAKFNLKDYKQIDKIANALKLELDFDYKKTVSILTQEEVITLDELAFVLLAGGILNKTSTSIESFAALQGSMGLPNPIKISIASPTQISSDIIMNSLNITLETAKQTIQGITRQTTTLVSQGIVSSGVTASFIQDDLLGKVDIIILGISSFDQSKEVVDRINVSVKYKPFLSEDSKAISSELIKIG